MIVREAFEASRVFRRLPLAPRAMTMAFIDAHREELGIEPICRELAVAPSSYPQHAARLAEAGLMRWVGSVGDSCDHVLAETINGPFKAEVIWRQRSWPSLAAVEMATLRWVDWFNNHRLFGPIGYVPPAEAEANYCAARKHLDMAA